MLSLASLTGQRALFPLSYLYLTCTYLAKRRTIEDVTRINPLTTCLQIQKADFGGVKRNRKE